uniref:C2H2-type domain-containing protein n=1 Tax=Globodera rostochiensis TaxID=31243 RepID=A0A914IA43_GLORO
MLPVGAFPAGSPFMPTTEPLMSNGDDGLSTGPASSLSNPDALLLTCASGQLPQGYKACTHPLKDGHFCGFVFPTEEQCFAHYKSAHIGKQSSPNLRLMAKFGVVPAGFLTAEAVLTKQDQLTAVPTPANPLPHDLRTAAGSSKWTDNSSFNRRLSQTTDPPKRTHQCSIIIISSSRTTTVESAGQTSNNKNWQKRKRLGPVHHRLLRLLFLLGSCLGFEHLQCRAGDDFHERENEKMTCSQNFTHCYSGICQTEHLAIKRFELTVAPFCYDLSSHA